MTERNIVEAAGLSEKAQAEIQYRCGYGCVRCGVTIFVYAVLPIKDETGWLAPSTILLCPQCFILLRAHPMQDEQYATLLTRPVMRDVNFNRRHLPYAPVLPGIRAAGAETIHDVSVPVLVRDQAPLVFLPPAHGLGALQISIYLSGQDGVSGRVVDANHWSPDEPGWRFTRRGSSYIVESDRSDARVELDFPTQGAVTIVHLLTQCMGRQIELTTDWIEVDGVRMRDVIRSGQLIGYRL